MRPLPGRRDGPTGDETDGPTGDGSRRAGPGDRALAAARRTARISGAAPAERSGAEKRPRRSRWLSAAAPAAQTDGNLRHSVLRAEDPRQSPVACGPVRHLGRQFWPVMIPCPSELNDAGKGKDGPRSLRGAKAKPACFLSKRHLLGEIQAEDLYSSF